MMNSLFLNLSANTLHTLTICKGIVPFTMFKFEEHPFDLFLGGTGSLAIYLLFMLALVFFFYKKDKALDFCGRYLTNAFVVVWISGFVIYDVGMYPDHSENAINAFYSLLGVAPMAIIHAFEMFVLHSDVSAIHDGCHNSSWFMFFFSVAHFLAAFISMVFVIKHFGFNIVASIIRFWKTHFWVNDIQNLFVFWGMNDATYYLAKDIIQNGHLSNSKIVIIRIDNEKEGSNERLGMERLFSFLSLTKAHLEKLQELQKMGCLSTNTFGSLANIPLSNGYDIIRKELRLNSLAKLIQHTKGTLHMFFLDDNDTYNIQAVANLRKDQVLANYTKQGQIKFYCHARYNSVHRVIEDELTDENIEVKVVDSSHISVELMKKDPELHPVNYVNVEEDATVSSPFNALVVGFGEVGLDTVRFLYEFGAFVKSDEKKVKRSDFHCHVIDQKMNELAGVFTVNAPSIALKVIHKGEEETQMINLYNWDCRSIEFYERLGSWIKTLNYIVIATGDDETNISLAVRLYRLAIRNRDKEKDRLEHFRILVRVQHDENGHIQKIAEHYNRLWAANEKSTDKNHLHQLEICSSELIKAPITLFGSASQVYTYEHVVNESLKEDAKKFKKKYDLSVKELKRLAGIEAYAIEDWDTEQKNLMQLTDDYKDYAPTFSGIMKLRRSQSQNIANSLHKETKNILAKEALGNTFNNIRVHGLTRKAGSLTYSWRDHSNLPIDNIQRVLDVLAQTEHLRWNASHEILGYQVMENENSKDEARLKHGCLKDWDKLSEKMQSNDYDVVDVSLNLIDVDENN